jgi:hypothetical protein
MLIIPNCIDCAHLDDATGKMSCKAFPNKIPDEPLYGVHDKVLEGQEGDYVFTPIEKKQDGQD